MDDPWGFPWVDEAVRPSPVIEVGTRRELVTNTKPVSLGETSRSPWDDDDGFGEWAALPVTSVFGTSLSNSGLGSELIEKNRDNRHDVRLERFARATPPLSQTHTEPSTLEPSGSQILPESWGEENILTLQYQELRASDMTMALVRKGLALNSDVQEAITPDDARNSPIGQVRQVIKSLSSVRTSRPSTEASLLHEAQDDLEVKSQCIAASSLNANSPEQSGPQPSRSSSPPSDRSAHEEELVESPGTSLDEDIHTRATLERKWPKQAKGYANLHDALATSIANDALKKSYREVNREEGYARAPITRDSKNQIGNSEDCEIERSGDLGKSLVEASSAQQLVDDTKRINRREYSRASLLEEKSQIVGDSQSNGDLAPVTFDVDVSLVAKLFVHSPIPPSLMTNTVHDLNDIENIIHNSFFSTEQRKLWYRVSRYGTMRKHNTGDEDTLVRANWKNSRVRAESIKIVARWIEEDRAGVELGAESRGSSGSLFGWGQKPAGPISISEVLASRNGRTNYDLESATHHAELAISETNNIPGPELKSEGIDRDLYSEKLSKSTASLITPQFSWSTGTTSSSAASVGQIYQISPSFASSPQNSDQQGPLGGTASREHSSLSPPELLSEVADDNDKAAVTQMNSLFSQVSVSPASMDSELDDDWGEMAVAPSIAAVIQTPLPKQRSASLGLVPPPSRASVLDKSAVGLLGGLIHQDPNSNARIDNAESFLLPRDFSTGSFDYNSQVVTSSRPVVTSSIPLQIIPGVVTSPQNILTNNEKSNKDEQENERIVKSIVQSLPDLSYMLRR